MTATTDTAIEMGDRSVDAGREHAASRVARLRRAAPASAMVVTVLIGAILPILRTPNFYYWDDTAGVAVGVWQRIAGQLLAGHLPFLQLDMWRGGNFIAEAATGMWNPVMLALMLATHPLDDVATAITIAKIALFLLAAGGVYVLARGYGASPWLAAVAGTVMPLSGWALFMDGTAWINGSAITAFTPWAWWAIRRCYAKRFSTSSIVVAVVFGYLLVSVGNPYGMVSLAAAFLAVAAEAFLDRRRVEIWWLAGLGFGLLLTGVLVYLPFVLTSSVGFRAQSGIYNDESLSPNLSDLLGLSTPTFKPFVRMFGLPFMTIPGMYLAWFLLPILPWLRWRTPGAAWRGLAGVLAFAGFYLVFVLGPTQFSLFRWPARLVPFFYMALLVIFAVVASHGVHRDRRPLRATLSVVAVGAGAWMAFSDVPSLWKWHALVSLGILILGFVFLRWGDLRAKGFLILAGGMIVFLLPQIAISPDNGNVANYNLPRSRSEMVDRFQDRYQGLTVQVADYMALGSKLRPDVAWRDLLAGNMFSVAGVESTTAYSGIGYTKLDNALCMNYNGSNCSLAWDALWKKPAGSESRLADLMNVRTVVVLRGFADDRRAPAGWTRSGQTRLVNVYTRDSALPHPDGRVSAAGSGVTVTDDRMVGETGERVTFNSTQGDRRITFARLAWPGYSASVGGSAIPVLTGPAGLLQVEVPAGVPSGEVTLSFTPPGLWIGVGSMVAALAVFVAIVLLRRRRRS